MEIFATAIADAGNNVEKNTCAVLQCSTELVAPLVEFFIEELTQEIVVSTVKFYALEASLLHANCSRDEVFNHLLDFSGGHCTSTHLFVGARAHGVCTDEFLRRTAASVVQLHNSE